MPSNPSPAPTAPLVRMVRAALGGAGGLVAGIVVTLGLVVARVRFEHDYLHSSRDLLSWHTLPLLVGVVAGIALGIAGRRILVRSGLGAAAGLALGAAVGAGAAAVVFGDPEWHWAGGVMGAAAGTVVGGLFGALAARDANRRGQAGGARLVLSRNLGALGVGFFLLTLAALPAVRGASPEGPLAADPVPEPEPGSVETVLFLVGDPGKAQERYYPILPRLQAEVERWSERLGPDGEVLVLLLGDVIYPDGLNAPGTPEFVRDTSLLMDQIEIVAGPAARASGARGLFVAGNHDWGLEEEWEGFVRLNHLDEFLEVIRRTTGARVELLPEAGTGGPAVLDLGTHLRLLLLDTAWWLLEADPREKARVLAGVEEALRTAGERAVVIAAHHPFQSAGPHGGEISFWKTLGVHYLLARSGVFLQDLNSIPYRELERGLRAAFARTRVPLVHAGGHEHSLQVIEGVEPTSPEFTLVSGSASKLTSVGWVEGMRFRLSAPGYIRLVIEKDGGVALFVEAAPERFLTCPLEDPEQALCMERGIAAYETVYSQRLR